MQMATGSFTGEAMKFTLLINKRKFLNVTSGRNSILADRTFSDKQENMQKTSFATKFGRTYQWVTVVYKILFSMFFSIQPFLQGNLKIRFYFITTNVR